MSIDYPACLRSILEELQRAEELYPNWPKCKIHQAAIVVEEAGELLRETLINKEGADNLEKIEQEAIQTAAMAIRFLEGLE